jgi:hypothetical protein
MLVLHPALGAWAQHTRGVAQLCYNLHFASKSFSIMLLGVPRLRRIKLVFCVLMTAAILTSCGSSSSNNSTHTTGLKLRALVSQDVSSNITSAGLIIIDALRDIRANAAPISASGNFLPGIMYLSDNRATTVAVSNFNSTLGVFNNKTEASVGTVSLPGPTDSVVLSPDGSTGYAAVSDAPVPGFPPGGIVVVAVIGTPGVTATVPVPSVRYMARSGDGSRILAFSDNSDSVTIVPPQSIIAGQGRDTPLIVVPGFDRPIFGFFSSDNSQAWVLNCGPECGGAEASVQVLDLIHNVAGAKVAIPGGATVGLISNQTLYVAGNPQPPNNTCAGPGALTTAATTCGRLTVVDLPSLTVTSPASGFVIQDGYHTLLSLASNGQLFIGSRTCTNLVPPAPPATGEQRGCLFIADTASLTTASPRLVAPPDNGDVTGIQPITNRTIVYLIEGGQLRFYDTTTDKITLGVQDIAIDILGQGVDVKLIDF